MEASPGEGNNRQQNGECHVHDPRSLSQRRLELAIAGTQKAMRDCVQPASTMREASTASHMVRRLQPSASGRTNSYTGPLPTGHTGPVGNVARKVMPSTAQPRLAANALHSSTLGCSHEGSTHGERRARHTGCANARHIELRGIAEGVNRVASARPCATALAGKHLRQLDRIGDQRVAARKRHRQLRPVAFSTQCR